MLKCCINIKHELILDYSMVLFIVDYTFYFIHPILSVLLILK
jgi:hypothetical protein